ncbi:hypothetical protein [Niabella drilacis]|uniref:Uncharacterized protein n=1 Tax=Niabella drilacis (strain DSM 25811 / CCM 8410 / CCUG 62505 / LMG 26954 / E90) TaxID=1285928 RepID=A0A1G6ZGG4_NIADE|nr:hypothetical protein [Niabella drilacis]SDE00945.1 hypothetical protein SAMN04487894_11815 [Niabella drilacis]
MWLPDKFENAGSVVSVTQDPGVSKGNGEGALGRNMNWPET